MVADNMPKKTILFLLNRECTFLPPFMTILDSLCDCYSLKVISYEKKGGLDNLKKQYYGKDVEFVAQSVQDDSNTITARIVRRVKRIANINSAFHSEALSLIDSTPHDLLWIIHEETLHEFYPALTGKKYIVCFYELNDHRRNFLDDMQFALQNAKEVMVPEYNRACILRVWEKLKKTPTVVPNKPLFHPLERNIPNPYSDQLEGKKIILYQGYIQRSRNIDTVCEAVKDMPDYTVVMMGKGDQTYIDELKSKYPHIIHISFVTPPNHLYITSYARIAIVKYDFVVLNAIFCAPNKTWEYTGFGIPVLCHNIPGLEYTIGRYQAGVCCDMDDKEEVKKAIQQIEANYDQYSKNAILFYNSCDIKQEILAIVERNI